MKPILLLLAITATSAFGTIPSKLPEFKSGKALEEWDAQLAAEHPLPAKASNTQEFFYTGKPYIATTGTYAFKYRAYNPSLSRWTTEDPSGFPDGANQNIYACNFPIGGVDPDGLTVYWIGNEDHYSQNATWEKLGKVTFTWNISYNGESVLKGSYEGTFKEAYQNNATVGFVTWRGATTSDFGKERSLTLCNPTENNGFFSWKPNGYIVTASILENAGAGQPDIDDVNKRINPIGASTSLDTLRGTSSYLYNFLLNSGAGYKGDLFYE